jgi:hypothetical protein
VPQCSLNLGARGAVKACSFVDHLLKQLVNGVGFYCISWVDPWNFPIPSFQLSLGLDWVEDKTAGLEGVAADHVHDLFLLTQVEFSRICSLEKVNRVVVFRSVRKIFHAQLPKLLHVAPGKVPQ